MNLTEWAHAQGIHVQTAYRWYREGMLPVPVQKAGRLILVSPETATEAARKTEGAGLYTRVSSHDQKPGLEAALAAHKRRLVILDGSVDRGTVRGRAAGRGTCTDPPAGVRHRRCRAARGG